MKKILSWLCIILLFAVFVSASVLQEGGIGTLGSLAGNDFRAYSWNLINPISSPQYQACELPGGNSTALSSITLINIPYYGSSFTFIVLPRPSTIEIYDYNCNLIQSIPETTTTNIEITDINENKYQEILFFNRTQLRGYEWNETSNSFRQVLTGNVTGLTGASSSKLSCTRTYINNDTYVCVVLRDGATAQKAFNISTSFVSTNYSVTVSYGATHENDLMRGYPFAPSDPITPRESMMTCTGIIATTLKSQCIAYYSDFSQIFSKTSTTGCGGTGSTRVTFSNAFYAKIGTVGRYLSSIELVNAVSGNDGCAEFMMLDNSGTEIISEFSATTNYSNIVVAPFIKSGNSVACYVKENTTDTLLICRNSAGFIVFSANATLLNQSQIAMADFNTSSTYLGIATSTGIYYYNASSDSFYQYFNSGYGWYNYKTSYITVDQPASTSAPAYVVVSNTQSIVVRDTSGSLLCGNDVCDASETQFNCPKDCSNYTVQCTQNSQCDSTYPKCFMYQCVAGYTGISCIDDTSCNYNASVCFNHVCVSGIYSSGKTGTNLSTATTIGASQEAQTIAMVTNQFFILSPFSKFVVGIIFILIFAMMPYVFLLALHSNFGVKTPPSLIPSGIGVIVALILDTSFGFFPIWFIVLFFLGCIGLFLIQRVIFPSGNSSG